MYDSPSFCFAAGLVQYTYASPDCNPLNVTSVQALVVGECVSTVGEGSSQNMCKNVTYPFPIVGTYVAEL